MLSALVAHRGRPPVPHDLWSAWNLDPVLLAGLVATAWAYRRGKVARLAHPPRPGDTTRTRCFVAAMVTLSVALVSPLDAMSSALASAHMVQHVLLVLVAAPLLALSSPSAVLWRGSPLVLRQTTLRWRRRLGAAQPAGRLDRASVVWLAHVGVLWFWHASGPYDAALAHQPVHVVEHAGFLLTGVLFWHVVVGVRATDRVSRGMGVLMVFTMAMQSVFLSALLTFARSAWYASYATTTDAWGLDALADQQLAGVIMWIPAGFVYLAAGLGLLVAWVQSTEGADLAR